MAALIIKGREVLVDDCDLAFVKSRSWQIYTRKDGRLSICGTNGAMARALMAAPKGMQVDHKNGDGLDNRRENLRVCTHQQNQWNRKRAPGKSRYKGVTHYKRLAPSRKPWGARIEKDGHRRFLGHFRTQLEAALAYDAAAVQLFGEYAAPNFPERFRNQ